MHWIDDRCLDIATDALMTALERLARSEGAIVDHGMGHVVRELRLGDDFVEVAAYDTGGGSPVWINHKLIGKLNV